MARRSPLSKTSSVCCSVLQRAAVCCCVVQCGAVWCSVLQCVAVMALDIDMTNEYMYTHMYTHTNRSDRDRLEPHLQQYILTHTWYMYTGASGLASALHRYVYIHIHTYTYTYSYIYTYIYIYSLTSAGAICVDCSLISANADTKMHIHTHNAYTHMDSSFCLSHLFVCMCMYYIYVSLESAGVTSTCTGLVCGCDRYVRHSSAIYIDCSFICANIYTHTYMVHVQTHNRQELELHIRTRNRRRLHTLQPYLCG